MMLQLKAEAAQRAWPASCADGKNKGKRSKKSKAPESSDTEPEIKCPNLTDEEEADVIPNFNVRVSDYVLVKVYGKTRNRYKKYLSVVAMIESDGDQFVTFLKKVTSSKNSTTEEDWVIGSEVMRVLPKPIVSNRFVKFPEDVDAD